jgi:hypothetical protein
MSEHLLNKIVEQWIIFTMVKAYLQVTPYLLEMDENGSIITEIIDKRLGEDYDMKSITLVAKVAMRCVQADPSSRPSASEVVGQLKQAVKIENKASISEEIGVESGDLTKREGMEWGENNTNLK